MSLVYITGVPGTGKTTVCDGLEARGYTSHDVDRDGLAVPVHNVTGDIATTIEPTTYWHDHYSWELRATKINELKRIAQDKVTFLCGTVTDDFKYWEQFDKKIALVATKTIVEHRLTTRTNHSFGKTKPERDRVLAGMHEKNARYQRMGAVIIDASLPISDVLDLVILHST